MSNGKGWRASYLNPVFDIPDAGNCCGGFMRSGDDFFGDCGNRCRHVIAIVIEGVPHPRKSWAGFQEGGTADRGFVVAVCTPCLHELGLSAKDEPSIEIDYRAAEERSRRLLGAPEVSDLPDS